MRAPVEAPLRHNDPASVVTSPHWLQWFQQSFDRLVVSFNGRIGAIEPQSGDYTAGMVTGAVPDTRTVNGQALTGDVALDAGDVGADPTGTTATHAALTAAHGTTGDMVGTTDSQVISNKKFGGADNYTEFEADGTMRAVGDATMTDDINISVQSLATSGATVLDTIAVDSNNFKAFKGTGVQAQQADGSTEILHPYMEGSDINPHIHWMPEDAAAGDVKLSLGYRWWNRGGVMPAETVVSGVTAAPGVAYQSLRTDFTVSGVGMTMGSRFVFRIFRDPADAEDTYEHYVIPLDFGVHYTKDTTGSRTVGAK